MNRFEGVDGVMDYHIESNHFCGDGICRDARGRRIRIANVFEGERVTALDVSIRRHRQALCMDVVASNANRCAPRCPNWRRCGACQYQCLRDEAQCRIKRDQWLRLIQKFVKIPEACAVEFLPANQTLGYRHRTDCELFRTDQGVKLGILPRLDVAVFELIYQRLSGSDASEGCMISKSPGHGFGVDLPLMRGEGLAKQDVSSGLFGLDMLEACDIFEQFEHNPVALEGCTLHAPELEALLLRVQGACEALGFLDKTRIGLEAFESGARVTIYSKPENASQLRILAQKLYACLGETVVFQVLPARGSHVYPKPESFGSPWFCYGIDRSGARLEALHGAWTPVNISNARLIRDTLERFVHHKHYDEVLEIGCGCGTHTPVLMRVCDHYTGIDAAWPAIQSAQHNAQQNAWDRVDFYTDTAEHYLDKRYYQGRRAQAILLHSNRMPYSAKVAEYCRRFGAKSIYIVAPTGFAMAQTCRHFVDLGYELSALTLCDTLPMTYHMMAVAHLQQAAY